ncbi:hypothetical protein OG533_28655 [Streptomyces sp. NBC_01186]|uniref:hypothetical protein n=1 Tax=Streptomyces sp. NBC_01186 TaxID=2903765 RepID=UPI002E148338|nr:hypothetical protein OG533_28655 [Streptomyces sp. NBC_01186]
MDKKDIPEHQDHNEEGNKKRKSLDLSVAQVLGSAVAAVVAAFAAGQLGVYGTFLGAGVVSLVATSGGPIFQHFFSRTGEQLKEVTVPPKARQVSVQDPAGGWKDEGGLDASQALRGAQANEHTAHPTGGTPVGTNGSGQAAQHTSTRATRLIPTAGPESVPTGTPADIPTSQRSLDQVQMLDTSMVTRMLPGAQGPRPGVREAEQDEATRVLGTVERAEAPAGPKAVEPPGHGEFTQGTTHGTRWRGWRRTLLPALVVFVLSVGGVTVYELVSGHNVSGGKGTSISDVFPGHGSSGNTGPDTTPTTPDPGQSEDGDGGSSDGQKGSGSPSADPSQSGSGDRTGEPGSGDKGAETTPTPDPGSTRHPGTTEGGGETDSSSDPDGSDSRQDDGDSTDPGKSAGAGGDRLPQRQQGATPQD